MPQTMAPSFAHKLLSLHPWQSAELNSCGLQVPPHKPPLHIASTAGAQHRRPPDFGGSAIQMRGQQELVADGVQQCWTCSSAGFAWASKEPTCPMLLLSEARSSLLPTTERP